MVVKSARAYREIDVSQGLLSQKNEIFDALTHEGAVLLKNHNVCTKLIDDVFHNAHQFFELPVEVKQKSTRLVNGGVDLHCGYVGLNSLKRTDNTTEKRETFRSPLWDPSQVTYPKELPNMKPVMEKLKDELYSLSRDVLAILAEKLGFDKEWFLKQHDNKHLPNFSNAKFNYYPPIGDDLPLNGTRFATHTDFLTLTILIQDQNGGLEFMNGNGEFENVEPIKPAIMVFAADFLERWSGGIIKAKVHRVAVPKDPELRKKPRISLIYVVYPNNDTTVEPLAGDKSAYETVKVDEYVEGKNEKIYAIQM